MNNMENIKKKLEDQSGMALVFALLIMMVLAVAALSSIMVTDTGLKTTSQFKVHQEVMYLADAGAEMGFGILVKSIGNERVIDTGILPVEITLGDQANLEAEIAGAADGGDSYADATPDIRYTFDMGTINIDIDYFRSTSIEGCADEYASAYEGIGSGGSGCEEVIYVVDSQMVSNSAGADSSVVRIHYGCVESGGRCL